MGQRIQHAAAYSCCLAPVVEEDPEYEFADNFRASRKSNQSRQMLLHQLSCRLRRQVGVKVRASQLCIAQSKRTYGGAPPRAPCWAVLTPTVWYRCCHSTATPCWATSSTSTSKGTAASSAVHLGPQPALCFACLAHCATSAMTIQCGHQPCRQRTRSPPLRRWPPRRLALAEGALPPPPPPSRS